MCHSIVQRTQLFPPRNTVIPESFLSYPDASGGAIAPPRSRPLVAGSLILVDGRSLSWSRCLCHESRSPVDRFPQQPAL